MKAGLSRLVPSIQGLTTDNLALLVAVGLVAGTCPIYGIPTLLCVSASVVLGLNFPALQLVNQLCCPLQIVLLVPLARLGSRFIKPSSGLATTLVGRLSAAALQAIAGWICICIPLGLLLYLGLALILRRSQRLWLPIFKTVETSAPIC